MLGLGQMAGFNALSLTTPSNHIFANIQDVNMYDKFITANNEI